jgi:hypothetical protein
MCTDGFSVFVFMGLGLALEVQCQSLKGCGTLYEREYCTALLSLRGLTDPTVAHHVLVHICLPVSFLWALGDKE